MLFTDEELERYRRHLNLRDVGPAGQAVLKRSHVLCVGAGGLGSPALLYLAAAGVGHLTLIDDDRVERSNLQRQVLHTTEAIGTLKVESARARLRALNPHIEIQSIPERFTTTNAAKLVAQHDVVLDGTDNLATRYLIDDTCVAHQTPWVYGAILRFEGQVSVFGHAGGPRYRDLFPTPPPPGATPSCAEAGVLGVLPGIIGSLQAMEVLKILLNIGEPLSGRVVIYDALATRFSTLSLAPGHATDTPHSMPLEETCPLPNVASMKPREALDRRNDGWDACWVDVRSAAEWTEGHLAWIEHHIPHDDFGRLDELREEARPIVLVCRSGQRAQLAAARLTELGHAKPIVLEGGMLAWKLATAT